jgi:hypothetical protein
LVVVLAVVGRQPQGLPPLGIVLKTSLQPVAVAVQEQPQLRPQTETEDRVETLAIPQPHQASSARLLAVLLAQAVALKQPLALPQPPNTYRVAQAEAVAFTVQALLVALVVQADGPVVAAGAVVLPITASPRVQAVQEPTALPSSSPIANDYALHRPKQPRLEPLRRPHFHHLRRRTPSPR